MENNKHFRYRNLKRLVAGLLLLSAPAVADEIIHDDAIVTGSMTVGSNAKPSSKLILDLVSTTKGVAPPRMTEAQRDAISSPENGTVIYNTDDSKLNLYDGSSWVNVGTTNTEVYGQHQMLDNGRFEDDTANWSSSDAEAGSTIAHETTDPGFGSGSLSYTRASGNPYLRADTVTVPDGLENRTCVAMLDYKYVSAPSTDWDFQAIDNTSVLNEVALIDSSDWQRAMIFFPCPVTTTFTIWIRSNSASGEILIDQVYAGDAGIVLGEVSQAEAYGTLYYPATASCAWTTTATSYGTDFSADTDCSSATVSGSVTAPGTKIPAAVTSHNGRYKFTFVFNQIGSTAANMACRLLDDSDNVLEGAESAAQTASSTNNDQHVVSGQISFNDGASHTVRLQCLTSTGTLTIDNSGSSRNFSVTVERYPLESQKAVTPDLINQFGSVTFAGTASCDWPNTNASYSDIAADASCPTPSTLGVGTDSGDDTPSITVANLRVGSYMVIANGTFLAGDSSSGNQSCFWRIHDGTSGSGEMELFDSTNVGQMANSTVIGFFNYSSVQSSVKFIIQGLRASGNASCTIDTTDGNNAFTMSVVPLSQGFPNPVILNSVSSSSSSPMRIVSAFITISGGTPGVDQQDGSWIDSIDDNGDGDSTLNVVSGTFSVKPNCVTSPRSSTAFRGFMHPETTTTTVTVNTANTSDSASDTDFYVICVGVR